MTLSDLTITPRSASAEQSTEAYDQLPVKEAHRMRASVIHSMLHTYGTFLHDSGMSASEMRIAMLEVMNKLVTSNQINKLDRAEYEATFIRATTPKYDYRSLMEKDAMRRIVADTHTSTDIATVCNEHNQLSSQLVGLESDSSTLHMLTRATIQRCIIDASKCFNPAFIEYIK